MAETLAGPCGTVYGHAAPHGRLPRRSICWNGMEKYGKGRSEMPTCVLPMSAGQAQATGGGTQDLSRRAGLVPPTARHWKSCCFTLLAASAYGLNCGEEPYYRLCTPALAGCQLRPARRLPSAGTPHGGCAGFFNFLRPRAQAVRAWTCARPGAGAKLLAATADGTKDLPRHPVASPQPAPSRPSHDVC